MRELRSITPNSRPEQEMRQVRREIEKLERDLNRALEISNRCITDRSVSNFTYYVMQIGGGAQLAII